MPTLTTLLQERHVEYVGAGVQRFVITSSIDYVRLGDLPHRFVFVCTIKDRADPKADVFARVGTIADLTILPQGRDAGLDTTAGVDVEYLTPSVVVSYADLSTAVAAEAAFKDRISTLVNDWITYATSFIATPTPETIVLPFVSSTSKAALLAAYKTAKQDRYAKSIAASDAADALTAAQATYTSLNTDVTQLLTITTAFTAAATALATTVADLAMLQADASSLAPTPMAASITRALAAEALDLSRSNTAATAASAANAFLATKESALGTALSLLSAASTANTIAQQNYTDAQATENAALGALTAVCPAFDPTTVCNVAG